MDTSGVSVPSFSSSDCSPPPHDQQCEGDDFHDSILLYINDLLMEEDIEHENYTPPESFAYQSTVKSFSDILIKNNEHAFPSSSTYGDEIKVFEQDFCPFKTGQGYYKQESNELYADGAENVSDKSSLKPSETVFCLQQEPAPFVLQNTYGNSKHYVSSESFEQQFSNETLIQQILSGSLMSQFSNQCLSQKMLYGPQISNRLTQHSSNTSSDRFISVPSIPSSLNGNLRSQFSHESLNQRMLNGSLRQEEANRQMNNASNSSSGRLRSLPGMSTEEPLQSSVSHKISFNSLPVSTDRTRLKRSSPEENHSDDDHTDNSEEVLVSFVKNKYLKAEQSAKALNVGLIKIIEKMKEMGPKTAVAPKSRKSKPLKLTATADLKNMLLSCTQAVGEGNTRRANEILKDIRQEATPYGDDLQRLAHYFAEGLVARISGTGAVVYSALSNNLPSTARWLKAHRLFAHASPFHKVSNFFVNGAIVKVAKDACRLHIIDYGIGYGTQWLSLISALAKRKGGPPFLRMTIIEIPNPGNNPAERVEWTSKKLTEYARAYGVPFEYQTIAEKWENVTASTVGRRDEEILVVSSMFGLHHVLDESVTPSNPKTTILKNILKMNPKLFVHGVLNGTYTSPFFIPRFREALSSYSSIFDMMEAIAPRDSQDRFMYERAFLGREIINVVACEGHERVERPTTYKKCQSMMESVGFVQMPFDEKMIKDVKDIVRLDYNKNFNVDTDGSWMLTGWKGKIIKAMTLWRPG